MTPRRLGVAFSVLMVIAIGVATLTPAAGVPTAGPWCIVCGDLGGVDFLANIVLFVPLGIALALATGTRRWPVLASLAFTLLIEGLQLRVIPGRDASLGDVLANSLGGFIGGQLGYGATFLLHPRRRTGAILALAWAVLLTLGFGLTSWGFAALPAPLSLWIQHTPERTGYAPFRGTLESFSLEGISLAESNPPDKKPIALALTRREWRATASVRVNAPSEGPAIIARIAEEIAVRLSVEQAGTQLRCRVRTRASTLRLRDPTVALDDALVPRRDGMPVAATCGRVGGRLLAAVTRDGETRQYELPLSPGIGWVLASPFTIPLDERLARLGLVWMLVLGVPLGYWLAPAGRRARADTMAGDQGVAGVCAAGVAVLLVTGLVVIPRVVDVAAATGAEWAALLIGVAGGAMARRVVYRDA